MKKTTTTTPSSSRCRTQKSVSYEWRPFEAPSKVPRPPPCESTGSCATRTRRTDLHLRVCADGAFGRSLNSARTKDLTFQAPKRDFLVPDAPKTSTLCTPHKLGRDPWLLICTWGGAQTRDLAIPVELSSIARATGAERRRNAAQFPRHYLRGVGNGMWFALVTLTTVGYGDRAPLSKTGRAIAGVWMVMSLLALSSITAGLASAFTVSLTRLDPSGVREKSDLRGRTVAVVDGTTSQTWAKIYGARAKTASTLNEAIDLLSKQAVEAVIFDGAPLRYYLQQNPGAPYKMAPFSLANQTFGFVVPIDSPLRTPIDVVLLDLQRKGEVKKITDSLLQ